MCDDQIRERKNVHTSPNVFLVFTVHNGCVLPKCILAAPCSDITRHAVELRDRGFTVIRNSGLDATLVAAAQTACSAEFERLQDMIVRLGLDTDNYHG